MSVSRLANHILAVADNENNPITNLQLQKILFFTIGFGIKEKVKAIEEIKRNYNDDFSRWRYGPVVPEIYHKYNYYGYRNIKDEGEYNKDFEGFDSIIENLLNADVFKMVKISHEMDAWKNYKGKILRREYVPRYDFSEIERDFINAG